MAVVTENNGQLLNTGSQTNTSTPNQNVLPVPNGQTPLTGNPIYSGAGGSATAAQYYAWKQFAQEAGRNPTQQELDQLTPSYLSGDKNVANIAGGNAAVGTYLTQQQQTPTNIYQQQQKQLNDQYTKNQSTIDPAVSQAFQSTLGRAPTQAESQYFGTLMASGQDQYQVQQALQQTQEYQNTQNTNFQNQLQDQLQKSNSTYFNQFIAPSLQAQNALSGQAPGSSALSSQLAQAALQQNQGLQGFLAQTTAQNYGNSVANATNQYNQLMGQQYGLQNANVSNALSNNASNTAYNQQLNLYQMQQQAYNNYLQQYGKRSGNQGIGSLAGGILGAGIGAYAGSGNPQAIATGYTVGSGAGGGIGALI